MHRYEQAWLLDLRTHMPHHIPSLLYLNQRRHRCTHRVRRNSSLFCELVFLQIRLYILILDCFRQPNEAYMILDMGGGTTDIAVHSYGEAPEGGKGKIMKEVVRGSGGLCGGSHVDINFLTMAHQKIPGLLDAFPSQEPEAFFKFLAIWDNAKRTLRGDQLTVTVDLPRKLQLFWKKSKVASGTANADDDDEDLTLTLSNTEVKAIFDGIVSNIVDLTMKQRAKVIEVLGKPPRLITFVGGLSESPYIRQALQTRFAEHFEKIFTPPNPGSAVAKGATLYGLNPSVFAQRIARRTYALQFSRPMEPGDPKPMLWKRRDTNEVWCDYLSIWVNEGDVVPVNHFVEEDVLPVTATQTNISYSVFSSEKRGIKYRCEDGVEDEFSVKLEMPPV
jgi:hypothetical protein